MQDLNDLFYFAKVVEAGGFTAAGRLLGIPKSRLSRRIAELEHRLGARLLQRSTRKLALTDIGERYLRHCQAMLLEAEQAEETVANLTSEPRGRVRFSTPPGVTLLPDLISEFLKRYPRVQLEVLQTSRRVDLLNEAVDVALRVRNVDDEEPSLITRRLLPARAHIVAHPELISGLNLEQPEDLQQLPALGSIRADRRIHLRFCHATTQEVREIALEARLARRRLPHAQGCSIGGDRHHAATDHALSRGTGRRSSRRPAAAVDRTARPHPAGLYPQARHVASSPRLDRTAERRFQPLELPGLIRCGTDAPALPNAHRDPPGCEPSARRARFHRRRCPRQPRSGARCG